jgi:excisionase family DNA binding protein
VSIASRSKPTSRSKPPDAAFLSLNDAAALTGLSRHTLRHAIEMGRLEVRRPPGVRRILIERAALDAFLWRSRRWHRGDPWPAWAGPAPPGYEASLRTGSDA